MKRITPHERQVSSSLSPNRTCQFPGIRLSMRGRSHGCSSHRQRRVHGRPEVGGSRKEPLLRVGIPSIRYPDASVREMLSGALPEPAKLRSTVAPSAISPMGISAIEPLLERPSRSLRVLLCSSASYSKSHYVKYHARRLHGSEPVAQLLGALDRLGGLNRPGFVGGSRS
jgi:hypothetical protein